MLRDLKVAKMGESVLRQMRQFGSGAPKWADPVELTVGDKFYLAGFYDISTDRPVGMSVGYIPWRSMIEYCQFYGASTDETERFVQIIKAIDAVYVAESCKGDSKDGSK